MKSHIVLVIGVAILCGTSSKGFADQKSHRKAAEELLTVIGVEKQLKGAIDQMLDLQIKANPQLTPLKDVMSKFLNKHMSWDSLKEEMIAIYLEAFDEKELQDITAFYRTPTGKKLVEKMPELMSKGMQLGVNRVQANQSELREMIQEEMKKKQLENPPVSNPSP